MYRLGNSSEALLKLAHPAWTPIVQASLAYIDLQLVESIRSKERQDDLHANGKSKLIYPDGRHCRTLDPKLKTQEFDFSDAIDFIVHPFGYGNSTQIVYAAGIIRCEAKHLGYNVRWGGDWDSDGQMNNRKGDFYDAWHFELVW